MSIDAPAPPADLCDRSLPLRLIRAGSELFRVHASMRGPIFFGPGKGEKPSYRFDAASGRFGVLYAAENQDAPLIETLLRNPARYSVSRDDIARRSMSSLTTGRDLRLVECSGASLSRLGTTSAFFTGPYSVSNAWSDALWDHPDRVDGILYPSRFNNQVECIALFERPDMPLNISRTVPLSRMLAKVGQVLDDHGKSIF